MLDVGIALIQAAERSPRAEALIDGASRWTYAEMLNDACKVAAGLKGMGLQPGDRFVSLLQNTSEAALLHWAAQLSGIAIVPLNWRAKAEELDYCAENAEAKALFFQDLSADAAAASAVAEALPRVASGAEFDRLLASDPIASAPHGDIDACSVMLYTSGTTGRPKGVPRIHRVERAAATAHVAQSGFVRGERSLGVMPLYHTMGVRSLLATALVDGCFICQPRFDPASALELVQAERITNLFLAPTLYHDLLAIPEFSKTDTSSVRKLGFAGASMTDGLLQRLTAAFKPELFINHYGSSEIYTFTIEPDAPAKPGSAGRAGMNQIIRIVTLDGGPDDLAPVGQEGHIIADLNGDEAFGGYWRRPDADEKSLRAGWYFTGDTGYFDEDGDLFVTGRVDDMIITGGENVSPVEIESTLSLHPDVIEVAVAGMPHERWGQEVTAFVKRSAGLESETLDAYCRQSDLANFKRPRRYVFVADLPKSPVGKILRRMLQSGDYQTEAE
jgi:2-furoate---CoA ligase